LGFPYNVSFDLSITKKKEVPCIKKGVLNSIICDENFLVDKMLASGFSGGPILMEYEGEYKVIGIISNASFQHFYNKETKQPDESCKYVIPDEYTLCCNINAAINLIKQMSYEQ
jgi:hypothetical protein